MQRILEIARTQLEAQGVSGLSLREVTRELGMVSSAVYRYVSGRDELLTLLLVDAFEDLAGTVDAALGLQGTAPRIGDPPGGDADPAAGTAPPARQQLLDLALAMRSWALAHRAQWTLLYGTPVAEYHAPAEATTHPGTRVIGRVLEIVVAAGGLPVTGGDAEAGDASGAGTAAPAGARAAAPSTTQLSTELAELLGEAATELGHPAATTPQLVAAVTFFSGIVGAINAELFTQWGPQFDRHGAELFTAQMRLLAQAVPA